MGLPVCIRVARELKLDHKWLSKLLHYHHRWKWCQNGSLEGVERSRGSDKNPCLVHGHQIGSRRWPLLCRGKNGGRPYIKSRRESVFLPGFGHWLDGTGFKTNKSEKHRKTQSLLIFFAVLGAGFLEQMYASLWL